MHALALVRNVRLLVPHNHLPAGPSRGQELSGWVPGNHGWLGSALQRGLCKVFAVLCKQRDGARGHSLVALQSVRQAKKGKGKEKREGGKGEKGEKGEQSTILTTKAINKRHTHMHMHVHTHARTHTLSLSDGYADSQGGMKTAFCKEIARCLASPPVRQAQEAGALDATKHRWECTTLAPTLENQRTWPCWLWTSHRIPSPGKRGTVGRTVK